MTIDNPSPRRHVAAAALAAAALAVGVLGACSSAKGSGTDAGAKPPAQQHSTGTSPTQAVDTGANGAMSDASANTLTITASDRDNAMYFDVSGSPKAGLVSISFINKGAHAHEASYSLLKDGVTLDQVKAALQKGEAAAQALLADPAAQINGPAILGPGGSEQVVAKLAAGHYVVACFLPGPGGMPHVMMGMLGEFTVAADTSDAAPPQVDGTVELTDSAIKVPDSFGQGGTFAVKNTGTKPHDFSMAKLSGAALPDYFQCVGGSFAKGTPIDSCPGTLQGGVTTVAPGATSYLTITLPAGEYSYVSTQGDGADFQAGLNGSFTVS